MSKMDFLKKGVCVAVELHFTVLHTEAVLKVPFGKSKSEAWGSRLESHGLPSLASLAVLSSAGEGGAEGCCPLVVAHGSLC